MKQQEKLARSHAERRKETTSQRAVRLAVYESRPDWQRETWRELPEAFDFRLAGEQMRDGCGMYVIEATPRRGCQHLAWADLLKELNRFNDRFYPHPRILRRMLQLATNTRSIKTLLIVLVANLSYRFNHLLDRRVYDSRPNPKAPRAAEVRIEAPSLVVTPFAPPAGLIGARRGRKLE